MDASRRSGPRYPAHSRMAAAGTSVRSEYNWPMGSMKGQMMGPQNMAGMMAQMMEQMLKMMQRR